MVDAYGVVERRPGSSREVHWVLCTSTGRHEWDLPEDLVGKVNAARAWASSPIGIFTFPVSDYKGETLVMTVGSAASGSSGGFNGGVDGLHFPTPDDRTTASDGSSDVRSWPGGVDDRIIVAGGRSGTTVTTDAYTGEVFGGSPPNLGTSSRRPLTTPGAPVPDITEWPRSPSPPPEWATTEYVLLGSPGGVLSGGAPAVTPGHPGILYGGPGEEHILYGAQGGAGYGGAAGTSHDGAFGFYTPRYGGSLGTQFWRTVSEVSSETPSSTLPDGDWWVLLEYELAPPAPRGWTVGSIGW